MLPEWTIIKQISLKSVHHKVDKNNNFTNVPN